MQKGEIYEIPLEDIDFVKKTVRISKSLQFLVGYEVVNSPKTKIIARTVRLNDKFLNKLHEYRHDTGTNG